MSLDISNEARFGEKGRGRRENVMSRYIRVFTFIGY